MLIYVGDVDTDIVGDIHIDIVGDIDIGYVLGMTSQSTNKLCIDVAESWTYPFPEAIR